MTKYIHSLITFGLFAFLAVQGSLGQNSRESISIMVAPEKQDRNYETGEEVIFRFYIFQYGQRLENTTVRYEIMPEQMEVREQGKIFLENGEGSIRTSGLDEPGFLRCYIFLEKDGVEYSNYATAAFDPGRIKSFTTMPPDFLEFWNGRIAELRASPLELQTELIPESSRGSVNTYHVRFRNLPGHIYGILCIPKKPGKYPALLRVPGAGVRPYSGEIERAEKGMITLYIGIHGIPVNLDPELYESLAQGALSKYKYMNVNDRVEFYYHRVILGCLRAVDVIFSLDEFDGENLVIYGGSQGGGLSIITAALDKRIQGLAVFYPAMCDLFAYKYGRAGGWPHFRNSVFSDNPASCETLQYYDVVNFARLIRVPGIYSWGYNDHVCPPSSMFAAYNEIKAEKTLYTVPDSRHFRYPAQQKMIDDWILKQLGIAESVSK